MHFFTSITTCYLPKARVLAESLKKYNPDAIMHLVIADDLPKDFNIYNEDFDYVWNAEDFIKTPNNKQWFFKHTVVELCTAIKPAAALHILQNTGADEIVFLDPDIAVYGNLNPLREELNRNSVLITPHQVDPAISEAGIRDEEICSLKYGVFNFGFFAVNNDTDGHKFLNWWNDRLMKYCYDDIPNGLFTDQKWGDLIPALFSFAKVLRNVEYNVATWNLATRKITGNEKKGWFVNGKTLKFYHFTGFDSGAHRIMLAQHAKPGDPAWNLSIQYEKTLKAKGQDLLGKIPYKYAFYENGEKILKEDRLIFRMREDLMAAFENPFSDNCYLWMRANLRPINIKTFMVTYYMTYLISKITCGEMRKKYKNRIKIYRDLINRLNQIIAYG